MKIYSRNKLKALLIICVFFISSPAFGLSGICTRILDGDTIEIFNGSDKIKIRLYGVDSPEKNQAFGPAATKFSRKIAAGKTVQVEKLGESYGRIVGIVQIDNICLNKELVKAGFAWVSTKYCKKAVCLQWKALEAQAKIKNLGLWADPDPVPPWKFRKQPASRHKNMSQESKKILLAVKNLTLKVIEITKELL